MLQTELALLARNDVRSVIIHTAKMFNVSTQAMLGHHRAKHICIARHTAMYLLRTDLELNFEEIGVIFQKDHTTAIHSFREIEKLLKTSEEIQGQIKYIRLDCMEAKP